MSGREVELCVSSTGSATITLEVNLNNGTIVRRSYEIDKDGSEIAGVMVYLEDERSRSTAWVKDALVVHPVRNLKEAMDRAEMLIREQYENGMPSVLTEGAL